MPRLRISVLGPVVVEVDGVERPVTARRQRAVLSCLALHARQPISADRLLDEVWGDDLPDTGVRAVAYQIAKLRSVLKPGRTGEGDLITTSSAGYTLWVEPDDVDAHRFERLVGGARDELGADPACCLRLIEEASALWRGRPFADLGDEPFVDRETRRLEQRHLLAVRTRAAAQIALGGHAEVIADLEAMVADHPLEEALVQLLMTALHRSGRTADALRAYGDLRIRLSDELGIEPAHDLQRLERELLAGDDTSPGTPAKPQGVPAALTSFVGRTDEIAEIVELLSSSRVVSLVGFGGLGKSRLAQEVARAMTDRFADGVWYVDLAPIADPTVLTDTILAAGGHTVPRDRDANERLLDLLADREALVVLDNCEHLVHDLADIATRIVRHAPHVRVLATSRVHLGAPDEAIFALHPLDHRSATELFTDRARLARPGFAVDDTSRPTVRRLSEWLDGIPLAIEMAAARLAVMSLAQIADHLDDRIELLAATRRDPDSRQRSLIAVMDWNYRLLDPDDRELLRRLSVCVGGFDLDAAVHIGTPDPDTSPTAVIDRLAHLVHASLVIVEANDDPPRYRILEPVRQYAIGELDDDEHHAAALDHARHYARVAGEIFDLFSSDHATARAVGSCELGNLRAAMSWCYRHDHPRLGLAIARHASGQFFDNQMYREVLRWLQTGLDLVDEDDDDVLAAAVIAGFAARDVGDLDAHRAMFERVQRGFDSGREPWLRAELLSARSSSVLDTDPRAAEADTRAAIEMRASAPARAWALLSNRIDQSWLSGDLHDGPTILQRLDEIPVKGLRSSPGGAKVSAGVAACDGRWDDVVRTSEPAREANPMAESSVLTLRAESLAVLGRHDEALEVLATVDRDSYERHRRYADRVHASIDLRRGEPRAAADRLTELADEIAADGRRLAAGMHVASLLGVAAVDLGQHEPAALLFGHAAAEQERLDIVLRPSDRPLADDAIEHCRTALGSDRFDELATRGAAAAWADLPRVDASPPAGPKRGRREESRP